VVKVICSLSTIQNYKIIPQQILRMDRLSSKPTSYNESDLADWLEQTGWLENDFQLAFKELQKEKQVENVSDTSNRRRKWLVHFNKSERLRRCV